MTGWEILLDEPDKSRPLCEHCHKPVPICCLGQPICCSCYDEMMLAIYDG